MAPTPSRSPVPKPAARPPRAVIEDVRPAAAPGCRIKRVVGEPLEVEATVYADGHDHLHVVLAHRAPGTTRWEHVVMDPFAPGLDGWRATLVPPGPGIHAVKVLAWVDAFASWASGTQRKVEAEVAIDAELLTGAALLEQAAERLPVRDRAVLVEGARRLRAGELIELADRGGADRPSIGELFHRSLSPRDAAASPVLEVDVERELALFSSWYELFPRSAGPDPATPGTLRDVERRVDEIAEMGFDILYLPPIHPIGLAFRKGPDNAEVAGPGDPGSPWAIGSPAGGHTAVHPELGTLDDLDALVRTCRANGLELALDIALQCSPDHPWVVEHPEWFAHRPDGSIQYAENPPKKYQDIYPLHFEGDAWSELWDACRDVVEFWADRGITVFRIDNPHTKPFAFWQWLIADIRHRHPDAMFLSEAFTRPAVMHRLAEVGFTQSYSYFPWRVTKVELTEYFTELSTAPSVDRFRPSSWPTTPDILPWHLMDAPLSAFAVRAFLAALLSPSYGIYGPAFELGDNRPAGNGKEEFRHSEKYQLRSWDRSGGDTGTLRDLLTDLNRIRIEHHALHALRTLRFHAADNDQLLCFSKLPHTGATLDPAAPHRAPVVVVANLDPLAEQHGTVTLDLGALGVDDGRPYLVHDLLSDEAYTWHGRTNYVELHPDRHPGHILRVTQA